MDLWIDAGRRTGLHSLKRRECFPMEPRRIDAFATLVLEAAANPEMLPDGSLLVLKINAKRQFQIHHYWPATGKLEPRESGAEQGAGGILRFGSGLAAWILCSQGNYVFSAILKGGLLTP
jgi:hypothetical protein